MRAVNHALAGALIGLTVPSPVVAMPLALASHFIVDALPHFGNGNDDARQSWFKRFLLLDAILCGLIVALLAFYQPHNWLVAAICAFLATSPDFMWVNEYKRAQLGKHPVAHQKGVLRFHAWIQWFERPIGSLTEVAWALAGIILLKLYLV